MQRGTSDPVLCRRQSNTIGLASTSRAYRTPSIWSAELGTRLPAPTVKGDRPAAAAVPESHLRFIRKSGSMQLHVCMYVCICMGLGQVR